MTDTQQPIRVKADGGGRGVDGSNEASSEVNGSAAPSSAMLQEQEVSEPLKLAPEEHTSGANLNGDSNEAGQSKDTDRYDPNFTQNVINATGPKASPRMRQVMSSLVRHVHDFAREVDLTVDEWMAGVEAVCLMIPHKECLSC